MMVHDDSTACIVCIVVTCRQELVGPCCTFIAPQSRARQTKALGLLTELGIFCELSLPLHFSTFSSKESGPIIPVQCRLHNTQISKTNYLLLKARICCSKQDRS